MRAHSILIFCLIEDRLCDLPKQKRTTPGGCNDPRRVLGGAIISGSVASIVIGRPGAAALIR